MEGTYIPVQSDIIGMLSQVSCGQAIINHAPFLPPLDTDKQMAINVFLGVFVPQEGGVNIWDLPTDYYLHHTSSRLSQTTRSYNR